MSSNSIEFGGGRRVSIAKQGGAGIVKLSEGAVPNNRCELLLDIPVSALACILAVVGEGRTTPSSLRQGFGVSAIALLFYGSGVACTVYAGRYSEYFGKSASGVWHTCTNASNS